MARAETNVVCHVTHYETGEIKKDRLHVDDSAILSMLE